MEKLNFDSDEKIKKVMKLSKQAALSALQSYEVEWETIRFNQLSETCTFKIETRSDKSFLLRIHIERSRQEIESELACLDALSSKMDVRIPTGLFTRDGARTVCIVDEEGNRICASMTRWVDGEPARKGLTQEQICSEGILLAKLHQASQEFELTSRLVRPVWDEQSFIHAMSRLKPYYNRFLSDAEFELYQSAADKIVSRMIKLSKDKSRYGIIHGDLHQGNIVFHNGEARPIDFGRCGFGYFIYDIAHTILGLYPAQRERLIKSYESIRKLENDWFSELESFTVMAMIENYAHHAPDPRETVGLKAEQPYAQAIIRNYLKGEPFLFKAIEVD